MNQPNGSKAGARMRTSPDNRRRHRSDRLAIQILQKVSLKREAFKDRGTDMPLDRLPGCREHCVADYLSDDSVGLTERCRSLRPGRRLLDLDRRNSR